MKTQLTLNIDEKKVKMLKQFSKKKGVSIAKVAEEIIDKIIEKDSIKKLGSIY